MCIKNAEFDAFFESADIVAKTHVKKVNNEKGTEHRVFDFNFCVQTLSAYNFFG